jgi:hypothetical protein
MYICTRVLKDIIVSNIVVCFSNNNNNTFFHPNMIFDFPHKLLYSHTLLTNSGSSLIQESLNY